MNTKQVNALRNYRQATPAQREALPNTFGYPVGEGDRVSNVNNSEDFDSVKELFEEVAHFGAENYISSAAWRLPQILKMTNGANKEAQASAVIWNAIGFTQQRGIKIWKGYTVPQRAKLNEIAADYLESVYEYLAEEFN